MSIIFTMNKKITININILYYYYTIKNYSIKEIAQKFNCSSTPINRAIKEHKLQRQTITICQLCKKQFTTKKIQHKYCSKSCCKKQWHQDNILSENTKSKRYYRHNISYFKEYNISNRQRLREKDRQWEQQNIDLKRSYCSKYRAAQLQQTIGNFNKEIRIIYTVAKLMELSDGIKRHVHHIIPLKEFNDLGIYGLHVPWNLQILTEQDHLKAHTQLRQMYRF